MPDDETMPNKTDTGWFTDSEQLSDFMEDQRLADMRMSTSFDDAQAIIAEFAASDGAGAWATLDRATVAERLATLIAPTGENENGDGYRSLSQAGLNLCGPAALLVMAMGRDPVAVARYATELFDNGTGSIGGFTVTANTDLLGSDFNEMSGRGSIASQAEWMMLSAIRNDTEPFWQPDWTGDPDQEFAGMTRPEELAEWLRQTGIWSDVTDNGRWASNPGIPDATSIGMFEGTDTAVLLHANLIKESTIVGGDTVPKEHSWSIDQYFPNHWVLLLSEVTPQIDDGALDFTIWTWGGRLKLRAPQQVFIDNYFGTVSASL
jgi:hypothetical protein